MTVKVSGPNDILYAIEDALPSDAIGGKDFARGLELGGSSWIEFDAAKLKSVAGKLYEVVSSYMRSRPSAEVVIGDVSIKLSNVSEDTINTAIDKAIEASR